MPTAVEEKLIDIKFKLDMYYSLADSPESTLEKIEDVIKPKVKLNKNQQIVLDYLKNIYSDVYEDCTSLETVYLFGGRRAWNEESNLTDKEEFQVLAAFAEWGIANAEE